MRFSYNLTNMEYFNFANLLFEANHVLIGGATGSGKSVLITDIIYSLIAQYAPDELKFVLIDPKKVDLIQFCPLPHVERHVTENKDIIKTLDEVILTMDKRYKSMASRGLKEYDGEYIVIVIDEIADLMTTCKKEFMPRVQRIAQLGRASRIKIICATQCPKREVIPAQLVVNMNGRVALHCMSPIESRQIINRNGAEDLPRYGKALYLHSDGQDYTFTIPLLDDEVVKERIEMWRKQTPKLFYIIRKIKHGF